jgi:hypothetical protein
MYEYVINAITKASYFTRNNFSVNLIHQVHDCVNSWVLQDGRDTVEITNYFAPHSELSK